MPDIEFSSSFQIVGGSVLSRTKTLTADGVNQLDLTIPDETTDQEVVIAIDFSALKAIKIDIDQDITIETNDGTTPDDTLSLNGGTGLDWHDAMIHANPLSADVTSLFITNASGASAAVKIRVLQDTTP